MTKKYHRLHVKTISRSQTNAACTDQNGTTDTSKLVLRLSEVSSKDVGMLRMPVIYSNAKLFDTTRSDVPWNARLDDILIQSPIKNLCSQNTSQKHWIRIIHFIH